MRPAVIAAAVLAAAALLTACDDTHGIDTTNKDPRKGRVTTNLRADWTGIYEYDWKVCVGGDLLQNIDGQDWWVRPSQECQS